MSIREEIKKNLVMIRGAGDLATGVAIRLFRCGFPVIMLDIGKPTVIRTTVAFASAMFTGSAEIEGVQALLCTPDNALSVALGGKIAVVVDPEGSLIGLLKPSVVVDAIIAKRNLGTRIDMAPFVVALGPGFEAPVDVDAVIETKRGHTLGRVIYRGRAIANTGIPGIVGGFGMERVMHSPCAGVFRAVKKIGDIVEAGTVIAYVDDREVVTSIGGKVRGMLTSGLAVPEHFKVADVDPRGLDADHTTCSDKALSIAGGVLEAVMGFLTRKT